MTALGFVAILATAAMPLTPDSVPLYDDLGNHHHEITTRAPRAQQYFDQGLRLIYGFNHAEAIASFEQALRIDPDCAMCYWGIAFAYGPNINLAMDSASAVAAYDAAQKALKLAPNASEKEQAYIRAIATRYASNPTAARPALDSAYANAMREVRRAHPDDEDAAVLLADALMNLTPWLYWTPEKQPRPGTQEILDLLRPVTERNLEHAGACHLYIHAVEAAYPERAVACADRLAGLMPGAGHIVHMPGHIYIRVGRYADAITANEHAIHEDESFIADRSPVGVYPLGYYPHNYHFLNFAAMMAGRRDIAVKSAQDLAGKAKPELLRVPGLAGSLQHYSVAPLFAHLRFEEWDAVLQAKQPPTDLPYATGLWRYARGVALARSGQPDRADVELAELRRARAAPELAELYILGYNTAASVLEVADATLAGDVAAARGRWDEAKAQLDRAAKTEDAFIYMEPPEWVIPPRQTLGELALSAGRFAEAEAAFQKDLERFPENVWSLRGLAEALTEQGRAAEAKAVEQRLKKALTGTTAGHPKHH